MKYCSKCGNALNDDMAFCPKCGEACIEQPTSPADQKLRDLESIHIILPKEELSWEYIRTHKDIGAIFAKQEKLAQQAVEIGKECMTLASMDEYNKIQEGVYRFYLQNAYALIDLAACLYEDSTELDAMWNEFKSLVAKGQLDAQKFINDMSSTDANYEIYAGLQILLSSYFTEALDSSVVADNESYQQAVVDILKRYTEALSLYLNRLKSHFLKLSRMLQRLFLLTAPTILSLPANRDAISQRLCMALMKHRRCSSCGVSGMRYYRRRFGAELSSKHIMRLARRWRSG